MAHGHKDYGPGAPVSTVYGVMDIAELAARLNSPDFFHRGGNILLIDGFEGSLSKYTEDTHGTGASVSISNERARHGDFSCKLVTGDAVGDWAGLYARLSYPVLSTMGFEVCWNSEQSIANLEIIFRLYDGTTRWDARVRWHQDGYIWQYYNSSGAWVALSPQFLIYEGYAHFNFTKLIVDFVNKQFVKLISNSTIYDMAAIDLYGSAQTLTPQLYIFVNAEARSIGSCIAYLDSWIVTQNETG